MPNKNVKEKAPRKLSGIATRNSISKTVPVQITYTNIHPLYKKRFASSKKILAHTEKEVLRGEVVTIEESKKISKNKAWKVISIQSIQKEETQG